MNEFIDGLYGPAAAEMRRFYETLETALRRHECINLAGSRMLSAYLTPDLVRTAGQHLERAKLAAQTELQQRRVDLTVQGFQVARDAVQSSEKK